MPRTLVSARRLSRFLSRFPDVRVAVLGDYMLDEFVWGRVSRISPEAPVPVVEVTGQTESPGGAGNVAANIAALGGRPVPFGAVGNDAQGKRLCALLRGLGMPVDGLIAEAGRVTTVKTRIIETSRKHQVVRADREHRAPAPAALRKRLVERLLGGAPTFHAVVISDYDKGTVTPELLEQLLPRLEAAGAPVFVDPRTRHPRHYRPITVLTPNEKEAERMAGAMNGEAAAAEGDGEGNGDRAVLATGRRLLDMLGCPYVLITRGERGMALFERGGPVLQIDTFAQEVYDVTGAGDTVIAALALAYAAGATMAEAAFIANCAAGRAVAHVGTVAPSAAELRTALLEAARRATNHGWRVLKPARSTPPAAVRSSSHRT